MPNKLLTIAGSDILAGGGMATDLKTFEDYGYFGLAVITCVATIDQKEEFHLENLPVSLIKSQLESIRATTSLAGIKIGLLNNPEVITLVADFLRHYPNTPVVLDPVLAFKESSLTANQAYVDRIIHDLLPLTTIVTPNLTEAHLMTGMTIDSTETMLQAAKKIVAFGASHVLIKGGQRLAGNAAIDVYADSTSHIFFEKEKINTTLVNGAGCMLASSITANLANKITLDDSLTESKEYVYQAIKHGVQLNSSFGNAWHNQLFIQKGATP